MSLADFQTGIETIVPKNVPPTSLVSSDISFRICMDPNQSSSGFLKSKSGVVVPGNHAGFYLPTKILMNSSSKSFGVYFVVKISSCPVDTDVWQVRSRSCVPDNQFQKP
jgi:hypothetical protein